MMKRIEISLGALAPHLKDQLPLSDVAAEQFEAIRRASNILRIHSYLTRAEAEKVERRIVGAIIAELESQPHD